LHAPEFARQGGQQLGLRRGWRANASALHAGYGALQQLGRAIVRTRSPLRLRLRQGITPGLQLPRRTALEL
jgi:hypothetical protein